MFRRHERTGSRKWKTVRGVWVFVSQCVVESVCVCCEERDSVCVCVLEWCSVSINRFYIWTCASLMTVLHEYNWRRQPAAASQTRSPSNSPPLPQFFSLFSLFTFYFFFSSFLFFSPPLSFLFPVSFLFFLSSCSLLWFVHPHCLFSFWIPNCLNSS